jgi:hypothetical protein
MGNYAGAIAAYDQSLAINPNNAPLAAFDQNLKAQHPQPPTADNSNSALGNVEMTGSASTTYTEPANGSDGGHDHTPNFFWDIGVGPAFGNGGGLAIGSEYYITINKNFSLGLTSNFYIFSATAAAAGVTVSSTTYLEESLFMLKYVFDGKAIRPYLMAGGGLDVLGTTSTTSGAYSSYYSDSPTGISIGLNPGVAFGGGIFFPLSQSIGLFVQGQLSILLSGTTFAANSSGSTTSSNSGTSFIPIEGGLTFPW